MIWTFSSSQQYELSEKANTGRFPSTMRVILLSISFYLLDHLESPFFEMMSPLERGLPAIQRALVSILSTIRVFNPTAEKTIPDETKEIINQDASKNHGTLSQLSVEIENVYS